MTYCTFLEGDQAEAYKKRKAEEKKYTPNKRYLRGDESGIEKEKDRHLGNIAGYRHDDRDFLAEDKRRKLLDNNKRYKKLIDDYNDEASKGKFSSSKEARSSKQYQDVDTAYDAVARHVRRHPDRKIAEAGIFTNIDLI